MNSDDSQTERSVPFWGVTKIVSGGQTGVDRAALDVAIELGIPHGGWCPKGRLSEAGVIPAKYLLTELDTNDYAVRTRQNVIDSDGTLILYWESLSGGTGLTNRLAKEYQKPVLRVRLDRPANPQRVQDWIRDHSIQTLNVAGPRASSQAGLEAVARALLRKIFQPSHTLFSE